MTEDQALLQQWRDQDAITRLTFLYATSMDRRQWELLPEIFTEDVTTDYGSMHCQGLEQVTRMITEHLGGCGPSQHAFTNLRIEVEGDNARVDFYGRVMHAGRGEQRNTLFDLWCEYQDKLVRTEQGWRVCYRRQVPFHAVGDPSILKPA